MAFAPTRDLAALFDQVQLSIPFLREVNGDGIEGAHAQGPVEPGMLGMTIVGEQSGMWSVESGYRAARAIPDSATALIAANDEMALGAMAARWESGRSVPGDVSVTGFDDVRLAPYARPGLTTIHIDYKASGQLAFQRLLEMVAPEAADRRPCSDRPAPSRDPRFHRSCPGMMASRRTG